jgi:protein-tyrosine phosphatase
MNSSLLKLDKGAMLLCSLPQKRADIDAHIIISLTIKPPFEGVLHMPIEDTQHPSPAFDLAWQKHKADIHARLDRGEIIAIHCHAGLGRTGTIAAKILIERGFTAENAIALIRQTRPGSIETKAQELYLLSLDCCMK